MEATWYARGTAGHEAHGQWAVYDDKGRDVAIVYDGPKHGNLIAAAPALLAALRDLWKAVDGLLGSSHDLPPVSAKELSEQADKAELLFVSIRQAEGGGE